MTEEVLRIFVGQGVVGAVLVVLGIHYLRKERAWEVERAKLQQAQLDEARLRISDAKDGFAALRDMQAKTTEAIAKLSEQDEMKQLQRELIDAVTKVTTILDVQRQGAPGQRGPR